MIENSFDDEGDDNSLCSDAHGCADCLMERVCELEQAMTRPLFDASFEGIERQDEWSGPHGFLFEPMTYPSKSELSRQFLNAAEGLVDAILRKEVADYTLAYPAMFLYRHSIELVLKCALGGDADGHKLIDLADIFARRCKEQHGQEVPAWITARLKEIAAVDPNSTAFRYAENRVAKSKLRVPFYGEFHVDLHHLRRSMAVLHAALSGVIGKIDAQESPRAPKNGIVA
jgi:hypothetical protein